MFVFIKTIRVMRRSAKGCTEIGNKPKRNNNEDTTDSCQCTFSSGTCRFSSIILSGVVNVDNQIICLALVILSNFLCKKNKTTTFKALVIHKNYKYWYFNRIVCPHHKQHMTLCTRQSLLLVLQVCALKLVTRTKLLCIMRNCLPLNKSSKVRFH